MNNSQEVSIKQDEMYRAALAAFILQARKTVEDHKTLYQDYVSRNFARIENDGRGGYDIKQQGQPTINIRQTSTITQRNIQMR